MGKDELSRRLGARIQRLRKARGLAQHQLAAKLNSSGNYISEVERGEKVPPMGSLASFAKVLGVSLSELFVGVDVALPREVRGIEQALAGRSKADQRRVLKVIEAALQLTPEINE